MPFLRVGKDDMVFEFGAGLLRGTQWQVDLVVCQSPCCPCLKCESTWSPVVATDTAAAPQCFWLDLGERRLERPPTDGSAAFAEAFLVQATANDWDQLLAVFRAAKQDAHDQTDLTTLDADFEFAAVEYEGLLVGYNEILPFHQPLRPTLGGQSYVVLDQYCLKPYCDCEEVHLSFCALSPPNANGESVAEERFAVVLDLSRRVWEFRDPAEPRIPQAAAQVTDFLAQVDPYTIFPERRRVLRALYLHNRHKFVTAPIKAGPKVGRNDPCPCGSGRKYKKCCMLKES